MVRLVSAVFVAKLLTSRILFLTAINAVFVAVINPLTLSILSSTSFNAVFVGKLLTSGILFSNSVILVL